MKDKKINEELEGQGENKGNERGGRREKGGRGRGV